MLEILSVCCYYSDSTASLVVGGMRLLARSQNEAPFACLSRALVQQDIEVKAAVMQVKSIFTATKTVILAYNEVCVACLCFFAQILPLEFRYKIT